MFSALPLPVRCLDAHAPYVEARALATIRRLAVPLRGVRVLHLSLGSSGESADLLAGLVPLLRDLGLDADWQVVIDGGSFQPLLREMQERPAGRTMPWSRRATERWRRFAAAQAARFDQAYDVVIVHGPPLAGLRAALAEQGRLRRGSQWVWYCGTDLWSTSPDAWHALLPAVRDYDACLFADPANVPPGLGGQFWVAIPHAIDPTSPRNMDLPRETVRDLMRCNGIDPDRPLVTQVSPLALDFDPLGAIAVYRRAKLLCPDLQLLLAHPVADVSPSVWPAFAELVRATGGDSDVHVLVSGQAGHTAINAAQRAASVAFQRAPGGCSVPLLEAQWKGRPVVAGWGHGGAQRIGHGRAGQVAEEERLVRTLLGLLGNPSRAAQLGAAGHAAVRERHLVTSYLAEELRLLRGLTAGRLAGRQEEVLDYA